MRKLITLIMVVGLILSACGDDGAISVTSTTATTATTAAPTTTTSTVPPTTTTSTSTSTSTTISTSTSTTTSTTTTTLPPVGMGIDIVGEEAYWLAEPIYAFDFGITTGGGTKPVAIAFPLGMELDFFAPSDGLYGGTKVWVWETVWGAEEISTLAYIFPVESRYTRDDGAQLLVLIKGTDFILPIGEVNDEPVEKGVLIATYGGEGLSLPLGIEGYGAVISFQWMEDSLRVWEIAPEALAEFFPHLVP